ncbi:hypothetical protein ACWDBF_21170 [Streptomyces angustmyceticus]
MTTLDEILAALGDIDPQSLRSEVAQLRAIEAWAMRQLDVDYKIGDRVRIDSPYPAQAGGGWEHYREALAPGRTGMVEEINFNRFRDRWYALVAMDRTWSVHHDETGTTRYWNGPASETPEGYTPPSKYDQQLHPDGKIKRFSMDVTWLAAEQP